MEAFLIKHFVIVISLLLIIPLISVLVQITFKRKFARQRGWITVVLTLCTLSISIIVMVLLILRPDSVFLTAFSFPWFYFGNVLIEFSIKISGKTVFMLVMINMINTMIQIISIKKNIITKSSTNYFASLSFLSFASIGAVLSNNLIFIYLFWELIGLSTCILIGYNFEKKSSSETMLTVFNIDRLTGLIMFAGIIMLFIQTKLLNLQDIYRTIENLQVNGSIGVIVNICFVIGIMGKAALFPFHLWLSESSKDSTLSMAFLASAANIGVGLFIGMRLLPILSTYALLTTAYIGGITIILGAVLAASQTDLRKIITFAAISQSGYVILGFSLEMYQAGFMHLVVQSIAFACLFIAAYVIIDDVGTADILKMGNLRKKIPKIFVVFCIPVLALCGFPITAAFICKIDIISRALYYSLQNNYHVFLIAMIACGSGLTAYYTFRMVYSVFLVRTENEKSVRYVSDAPGIFLVPISLLCSLLVYVWYTLPYYNPLDWVNSWFMYLTQHQVFLVPVYQDMYSFSAKEIYLITGAFLFVNLIGFYTAYLVFHRKAFNSGILSEKIQILHKLLKNEFYLIRFYRWFSDNAAPWLAGKIERFEKYIFSTIDGAIEYSVSRGSRYIRIFDELYADRFMNFLALGILSSGKMLRFVHTGRIQSLLAVLIMGIILLLIFILTN